MLLAEKVALITGAGNGIGRATALRFVREGAQLVLSDLDPEGLAATQREIVEAGGKARVVAGNVAERADAQRMVEVALEQFGRLDILINNAGIARDGLTTRLKEDEVKLMSDEQWDAVLEVNLKGAWLCAQAAAIPMMRQKYGRIVNTASVAVRGNVGQANYAASKAGLIGLTRTLALEWARFGIAVNCIAPGRIMSEQIRRKYSEEFRAAQSAREIPVGRYGEPEELACLAVFLASPLAGYITGAMLPVDGGLRRYAF